MNVIDQLKRSGSVAQLSSEEELSVQKFTSILKPAALEFIDSPASLMVLCLYKGQRLYGFCYTTTSRGTASR